ncbi:helix-turn-helix domain-containing protein [Tenacibaculum agarivorans]|uniref:helix-turn-helix domain-containing protein n=1 Tax=Tenacibaculum agarivorans TaxID=1908389 RepID=UPI00094B9968|nr:helix-turn-helix domain-containing protein [Tenacibaculum agarivorans]
MSIKVVQILKVFSIILLYSFCIDSCLGFQSDIIKIEEKEFIQSEKNLDKIHSFLKEKYTEDLQKAKTYFEVYLERGVLEKNENIQLYASYYLSDIAYENGDYLIAADYSKSMLKTANDNNNSGQQISALNQLGNIYYKMRNYDESLNFFIQANEIHRKRNPNKLQIGLLTNINMIRTRAHRYTEALVSYNEIIDLLEKDEYKHIDNYWANFISLLLGKGVCYFHLKEYDLAIQSYKEGKKMARNHKLNVYQPIFNMTIGEAYTGKKMYDEALKYLFEANRELQSTTSNFDPNLHTSYFHLATVFYQQQEYQKALDYLSESFIIIEKQQKEGEIEKINEMYDMAYNAAKKINNKDLIIKYGEAYRRVIDAFHLDDIRTKDRLYDKDISELEEKNQNLSTQKTTYITLIFLFTLIILGLSVYFFKKEQQNKKLFQELTIQQKENIQTEPEEFDDKPSKKELVTDEKVRTLLKNLKDLEETNFFLAQDCSLYTTAKLIDTNTTYLSKIINDHKQQSFNEYINALRINYFLVTFKKDKKMKSYTIKAIATELGYKSVNTFASAFKKQTGISHSYFIKQTQKELSTI